MADFLLLPFQWKDGEGEVGGLGWVGIWLRGMMAWRRSTVIGSKEVGWRMAGSLVHKRV